MLLAAARFGCPAPLVGRQHHDHVSAVELGGCFDLGAGRQLLGDLVEDLLSELGMGHLPATEHDRDLHFVALVEEVGDLASLGVEVAAADLGAVLHLLDLHVAGLAA